MKILVINPNSDSSMTADIRNAAESYADGRFQVITSATPGAPLLIDTLEDAVKAAPGMLELVRNAAQDVDAFVVACACDPNLLVLREITDKPVIGIGQASMYMASQLGRTFTILQTDSYSIPQKRDLVKKYHMDDYLASVRTIEPGSDPYEQYLQAARLAMKEDGAECIILGCAGLCTLQERLEHALGIPVLDGVLCGLAEAESFVRLGLHTSKVKYYSAGNVKKL